MYMTIAIVSSWALIIGKLFVATLCGGLIGYQRELYERPAGFRTHVLVCVGSAVYMLVSVTVAGSHFDPGRIAAQVASGIGFLGAGTIIKQGSIVRGLTTAASLWAVAGIGLAAGYGGMAMSIAVIGALSVFLALTLLKLLEIRMERGRRVFYLTITLSDPREHVEWAQTVLAAHDAGVSSIAITHEVDASGEIDVEGHTTSLESLDHAIAELMRGEWVRSVHQEWR
jgi:putative Mg2+ transporter-C (MgtC) family protein